MRFRDTLNEADRHLVERTESFGDIVVGFSLSLLALQLVTPTSETAVFSNPIRYVLFFGTFAIIVAYWLRFTKIMSTGFRPTRIDMVILFVYLAFVALLPYSLQVFVRSGHGQLQQAAALYLAVFAGVTIPSLGLHVRGARNAWPLLDDRERREQWRSIVVGCIVLVTLLVALVTDLMGHLPEIAVVFLIMGIGIRLVKRFLSTPRPRLLGITETTSTTEPSAAITYP